MTRAMHLFIISAFIIFAYYGNPAPAKTAKTETPLMATMSVAASVLNCRVRPDPKSKVVRAFRRGATVILTESSPETTTVDGKTDHWRLEKDARCWLFGGYLEAADIRRAYGPGDVVIRNGPSLKERELFRLQDGTRVRVMTRVHNAEGLWLETKTEVGKVGWAQSTQLMLPLDSVYLEQSDFTDCCGYFPVFGQAGRAAITFVGPGGSLRGLGWYSVREDILRFRYSVNPGYETKDYTAPDEDVIKAFNSRTCVLRETPFPAENEHYLECSAPNAKPWKFRDNKRQAPAGRKISFQGEEMEVQGHLEARPVRDVPLFCEPRADAAPVQIILARHAEDDSPRGVAARKKFAGSRISFLPHDYFAGVTGGLFILARTIRKQDNYYYVRFYCDLMDTCEVQNAWIRIEDLRLRAGR